MDFIKEAERTSMRSSGEIIARLLIDTKKERILFISSSTHHPDYLAAYLGTTLKDLKENPEKIRPYVGAAVRIENGKATGVMVGISGLEMLFGKKLSPVHTKAQVNKARDILIAELLNEGLLTENYKFTVLYK